MRRRVSRAHVSALLLFCMAFNWLVATAHACIEPMQEAPVVDAPHCAGMAAAKAPQSDSEHALCMEQCNPDEARTGDLRGGLDVPSLAPMVHAHWRPWREHVCVPLRRDPPRALGPPPQLQFCVLLI